MVHDGQLDVFGLSQQKGIVMMKFALSTALAITLVSSAQAASPQIPTPANPEPQNPIATDGSPLPSRYVGNDTLLSGRSVFAPVGAVFDVGARTTEVILGR